MPTKTSTNINYKARLTVSSEDHLPVLRTVRFWASFEDAYGLLNDFLGSLDTLAWRIKYEKDHPNISKLPDYIESLKSGKNIGSANEDALIFGRIHVSSPGFWEVIGKWMPFDVIRKALMDAHERRKDRNYREDAEAEKGRWQNVILQAEAAQAWIKTMREAGASDEDVQKILSVWLIDPLHKLKNASQYFLKNAELEREDQQENP